MEFVVYHLSFVLFSLLLLWRPLFAGEAFFWGTPLLQFVPWQRLAADMWRSGHLPLWNPLVGCGASLAANYQTGAFYPFNAFHLLMRTEVALSWTVALHLALTGWGMYRWGRSIGLDRFPAFVGALALEGSGFVVARAALFPSIALTFPWLAVWLWRGEVLIQNVRPRDALSLGFVLGLGLLAGHAQTASYGGLLLAAYLLFRTLQEARKRRQATRSRQPDSRAHPLRFTFYDSRFTFHDLRFTFHVLLLLLLSLVLALGLAAVQLLPTAELLIHSQRATGVGDEIALTYSFWPWRLITFVAPDFFGNPGRGTYWGYATYWEDAGYVGVLPLLLAAWAVIAAIRASLKGAARQRNSRFTFYVLRSTFHVLRSTSCASTSACSLVLFWTSTALISLLLALGKNTPLFLFLFRHIPGFDLFKAPTRWLSVTTLALAALAAIGAHHWPRGHRARRLGALALTVGGALITGALVAPRVVMDIPSTFGPATVRLGLTLILVGALTLLRARMFTRVGVWWYAAVVTLISLDLLAFGWPLIPTIDRALYRGKTSTAAALQTDGRYTRVYWPTHPERPRDDYDAHYRVKFDYLAFEDFGPADPAYWRRMREAQLPNAGMLDGIASANNFDPLLVGRYVDLLEAVVEAPGLLGAAGVTHVVTDRSWPGGEPVILSGPATFYRLSNPLGRVWIVPQRRSVAPQDTLEALKDPAFDPATEVLLEAEPSEHPRSQPTARASRILSLRDTPNAVTIRANLGAPGYLVLADTWYPGWKATVDGEQVELLRANHAFRAVKLEAGTHTVEMVYRPPMVQIGGLISLTAVVSSLAWLILAQRL